MLLAPDGTEHAVLQVHASNGQYEAALQSCFSAAPDNGASHMHSPAAGLSGQMEVADAVLRLVADNAATPSIRCAHGGLLHACLLATMGAM
jgi:hypothetical protein